MTRDHQLAVPHSCFLHTWMATALFLIFTVGVESNGAVRVTTTIVQATAGDTISITLRARDSNGNPVRSWRTSGTPTTIRLVGSTANTDTSSRTWNADPFGFSFATVLDANRVRFQQSAPDEWLIPSTEFDTAGVCIIRFVDTKAEAGVTLNVISTNPALDSVSEAMNMRAGRVANFLLDITWSTVKGRQVYHLRPYEFVVTPRDRYLNPCMDTVRSLFTARFPGEFDSSMPGLADLFSGDVFISGQTPFLIGSDVARELPNDQLQWIMIYSEADDAIRGISEAYEILTHAPAHFGLLNPVDHKVFNIDIPITRYRKFQDDFVWERPVPADPYTGIRVSRFETKTVSDEVRYSVVVLDSVSLTRAIRFESNNTGELPTLTFTEGQLNSIMDSTGVSIYTRQSSFCWFVEARDGVYTTRSDNGPGRYFSIYRHTGLTIDDLPDPEPIELSQNCPNPVVGSTDIHFTIPRNGKTVLTVYDMLGLEVQTLVNEPRKSGSHVVRLAAGKLNPGVYFYLLRFEDRTLSKRIIVTK